MEISKYESLTKLNLTEIERTQIEKIANKLIVSFEDLREIDTKNVEPLVSVLVLQNVLREDINVKSISREELLSNAPEQYGGYFQVPKTLD
ncbi:MAG: Asp-tRNA(Asn)/Glu-tRNA(Gln) amidotransferase subunit GatC [Oscillospiraceae bacterium]|nr:Asp-tRNA(Asn)/Glu-tRNA(Gln) amidotransferase subunit GatC [Oscillospiraceae bacterium]